MKVRKGQEILEYVLLAAVTIIIIVVASGGFFHTVRDEGFKGYFDRLSARMGA